MKKIVVGTKNQRKLDIVENIFKELFDEEVEIIGCNVDSGVAEAPIAEETYQGAFNRAQSCREQHKANYYIGLESGLITRYGSMYEEAWAVVLDSHDGVYSGYSSGLSVPKIVTERMEKGILHDQIMQQLDVRLNLPPDNRDTWSRYSGGVISRVSSFHEALRNSFVQIVETDNNLYRITRIDL